MTTELFGLLLQYPGASGEIRNFREVIEQSSGSRASGGDGGGSS
jgi:glycine cleavage system pyridoxal-binding protein P